MDHILLLAYLVALMVGVAAAVTAQMYSRTYRYTFLRFLVRYIIFLNLALFIYFLSTYMTVSSAFPDLHEEDSVLLAILFLVAIGVWVGCVHSFIHLTCGLRGRDVPGKVVRLFQIGLILVGVMCVAGVTTFVHTGSNRWTAGTYIGVIGVTTLVFFSGVIGLLRHRDLEQKAARRRAIRAYGWLHAAAYGIFFTAPFLAMGTPKIVVQFAALVSLNLAPLVWLRRFFLRDYVSFLGDEARPPLDAVVRKHEISAREREVMELILEGKSNQEIEKMLFISYNTVKNHIYSIYRKLGVKSRGQMIHLVLGSLKDN
ncbi:LuxR C-terminal-related transcriptional regulator [Acidobacteriota bacterium]